MCNFRGSPWVSLLFVLCFSGVSAIAGTDDETVHAFEIGTLWTGAAEPVANAVMTVSNGRITAVGSRADVAVPAGAIVHNLKDAVVIPGLVIAETSIGIADDDEKTLTPEVLAIDGFDLFADYSRYVAAGVTTVQISPGRQRLMPGQGAVVKLAGDDPARRILSRQESLRIVLGSESVNAPRIYEPPVGAVSVDNPLDPTVPQIAESLSARLAGLRAVFKAAHSGETDSKEQLDFAAIRECLDRGRLRMTARTAAEIRAALRLFAELQKLTGDKLQLVLSDPEQLESFVTELGAVKGLGVILNAGVRPGQVQNPAVPDPADPPSRESWENAALLAAGGSGDAIAIRPASDSDLTDMLFLGGLFTRSGTPSTAVLRMLTANPARILGVEQTVGTLAVGRDADFVVLTGEPFAAGTIVQSTWINGEREYDRESANRTTLIQADAVFTSDGNQIANAAVVVSGKRIQSVGVSVSIPEDAAIRRFPGAVIVPGFVDLGTGLGLGGPVTGISLATTLGDQLASDDPSIKYARQGGVTTAVFATTGSPSPLLAFKLGDVPRLLKEPVGIRFSMPGNLTSGIPGLQRTLATGKAYADSWTKYDRDLADYQVKHKEYEAALAKYEATKKAEEAKKAEEQKKADDLKKADDAKKADATGEPATGSQPPAGTPEPKPGNSPAVTTAPAQTGTGSAEKPAADAKPAAAEEPKPEAKPDPNAPQKPLEPKKPTQSAAMEPFRALFAGTIPAVVEADGVTGIAAALKLFRDEFQLKTILVGASDLYRVADDVAKAGVSVAVGPSLVRRVENETINLPQVMANHQIPFGFQSNATTGVRQLPLAVQYAVYRGLGRTDALNGLTAAPAKMLSLESQIGAIEPGKDADLVVLSGPPFEVSSEVLAVMIDGEWVYERGAKP